MSFIFKLLKFPFPFDCSLKLLCISLAQRADSPLNNTILQTILFLAVLNQQIVQTKKKGEKNKNNKICSFVYRYRRSVIGFYVRSQEVKTFVLLICFIFYKASKMSSGCKQIVFLHQHVPLKKTTKKTLSGWRDSRIG